MRATIHLGQEQLNHTKSVSGIREVDLYPSLNNLIAEFAVESGRQPGDFLFQSAPGEPLRSRTILNRLRKHGVQGFHAARRFRITRLENAGVPRGLIQYWAGHSAKDVTDLYVRSAQDVELRKNWAARVGLGFSIEKVGPPAPKPLITKPPSPPKPTKPDLRRASMVVKKTLVRRKSRSLKALIRRNAMPRSTYVGQDSDVPDVIATPQPEAVAAPAQSAATTENVCTDVHTDIRIPITAADIEKARQELESLRILVEK